MTAKEGIPEPCVLPSFRPTDIRLSPVISCIAVSFRCDLSDGTIFRPYRYSSVHQLRAASRSRYWLLMFAAAGSAEIPLETLFVSSFG
jgi:hypothetical protein